MNFFTWSNEDNDWIIQGDKYNGEFKTGEDLSIMVNSVCRPSRRRKIKRIHAPSMQILPSIIGIHIEVKPSIPIKSYKDQFRNHMVRNGIWGVISLQDPQNEEKKWDLILNRSILTWEYIKMALIEYSERL